MKEEELKKLLRKYYDGETSTEEEKELSVFFTGGNVPEGYEYEKAAFAFYQSEVFVPEPSGDFEERIISALDEMPVKGHNLRRIILPALAMAAAILILIGMIFIFNSEKGLRDTYTDPQIAYAEAMKILYGVSVKMNKAETALSPFSDISKVPSQSLRDLARSTMIVEKTMKELEPVGSIKK